MKKDFGLLMVALTFFSNFFVFANFNVAQPNKELVGSTHQQPTEITRDFYQPIEFHKSSLENNGKWAFLFLPKFYNTKIKLKLPQKDLKIIKKETLKTFLRFDLNISWWGPRQGDKKLAVNLSKELSFSSFQRHLECGEIFWNTASWGDLKIKPLFRFFWTKDSELTLEHFTNDFLNYDKLIYLSSIQGNGLGKMNVRLFNLKLVYKIPEIFNKLLNLHQPIVYFVDPKHLLGIDQLISGTLKKNSFLRRWKFEEYFQVPKLSLTQKTTLLAIDKKFTCEILLRLELKEKYN